MKTNKEKKLRKEKLPSLYKLSYYFMIMYQVSSAGN